MSYGKLQESEKTVEVSVATSPGKTRKNNISKRQRISCFQDALPDFLKASEKYKPAIKIEFRNNYAL